MNTLKLKLAALARRLVGSKTFWRSLPPSLGGGKILVSPSADIRYLRSDLSGPADELFELAERFVEPGSKVWDIGSNVGLFGFPAAARAGAEGRVLMVEPDPRYIEMMHQSRARQPANAAAMDILPAAVSDEIGIAKLAIVSRGHAKNHLVELDGNWSGDKVDEKAVVSVTADWLLEEWGPPDLVKIDVEGAEIRVLHGASRLLREVRPRIYIEVSSGNIDVATEILCSAGYSLYRLEEDGLNPVERCDFNTLALPE